MGDLTFKIFLIKPSHYDEDGYVIQWRRSLIPANSLASVYGLMQASATARVLGADVQLEVTPIDETNTVVNCKRMARQIEASDGGLVCLVGVQSNQFPRAVDIARQFRERNIAVVIGGFHVSGCLSMLPKLPGDIQQALDMGISLFAGEAEGQIERLLRDAFTGTLKPIYNCLRDLPDLAGAQIPILPKANVRRLITDFSSFDAGRGCPFQCSFCTIINVQGRKSRHRTADDVEAIIRSNAAQGVTNFFVTDDNFARNRNWESILDRIISLRQNEGLKPSLIFQVDTLCHRIPGFIEKVARAGCISVFIGLENINPESLMGSKKRQNKIWEYREMLLAWRGVGVITCAGYILGFPTDTSVSVAHDIETIQRELPIDILEFFILTPLPGSEDHKVMHLAGTQMDPDMNRYDLEHACSDHPLMDRKTLERVYRDAWSLYYTDAHVETLIRRAVVSGLRSQRKLIDDLTLFAGAVRIEGVHPLQFGLFRRKIRGQRRHGIPIQSPLSFYPLRLGQTIKSALQWIRLAVHYRRMRNRVVSDPATATYSDLALTPATTTSVDNEGFVSEFAAKIPNTHGAPKRAAVV